MGMNIEGFINALYEKTNSGALGVSYIKPGNAPVTKWFTRDQLDDMAAFIRKCGKQYNTYININPRQNALDTCHRGESTDISEVVGLYMDFDIKGEAHKEKRLPEKAGELQAFIHQLSMKPSIIVVSSNGIHCYWLLKESFQIKSDDDREYISGLLSGYEQYVSEQAYSLHGWNFDHVADLARMLRAPDTTNFKTSDKLQCRIIEASDTRYDPSDFEVYAKRLLSEKRATSTVSDDADSFSLMGTGSARELINKCRFLQHCRDDAVSLSEPDWYAAITNLAQTADGHDVIHEISSPYPGYSYQETERKYIHAAKEDKPVTCDRIKHVHCFDSRPEYLGHTVNFKTYRKSYKQKKQLKNDPSEWQIFENTHEAIIDQETYDIVQRIRDGRRRWMPMGEMPVLSGMVFCADCGAKLYQVRGRSLPQSEYMVCATYRKKGKEVCPSHQTRNSVIEMLLLDGIRSVTSFAREHEDEFVEMVTKKKRAEVDRSLRDGKRELEQAQTRIRKLDEIIQHLYEDNLEGKISNERFMKLSENYENEQKTLESRVAELKRLITSEQEANINVDRFLGLVRKYTDIKELNAEIIREFVDRIYVHQTERINGRKIQRIRIVWNCIGEFTPRVPEPEKETA